MQQVGCVQIQRRFAAGDVFLAADHFAVGYPRNAVKIFALDGDRVLFFVHGDARHFRRGVAEVVGFIVPQPQVIRITGHFLHAVEFIAERIMRYSKAGALHHRLADVAEIQLVHHQFRPRVIFGCKTV